MESIVIAGYAGIGKTILASKYQNVRDMESSDFKYDNGGGLSTEQRKDLKTRVENPGWWGKYTRTIQEALTVYDIVCVSTQQDILDWLDEQNVHYVICYPDKSLLEMYKERYASRGNNTIFADKMTNPDFFESRIADFEQRDCEGRMVLGEGETLEDRLLEEGYKLVPRESPDGL